MTEQIDPRQITLDDMMSVIRNESGRRFIHRILTETGVDEDTFKKDTHEHARLAGRREIGIWLRDELKLADTDNYFLMMKENI